jgi:hypothetical protein
MTGAQSLAVLMRSASFIRLALVGSAKWVDILARGGDMC